MKSYFTIFIVINFHCIAICEEFLPILFWHSAGESCCESEFQKYSNVFRKYLSDEIYVKSVQLSPSMRYDKIRSLTMHPFEQIEIACKSIKNDTKFHNGYNAIGLSQGALLLRGLAQTCPFPKMKNFISFGGPQQGIYQYPHCGQISKIMCTTIHYQLNALIYSRPSQYLLTPASYWHDLNPNRYQKGSTFLAIINNEKDTIIADYAENLKALERFVMVKYESDEAIIPNESTFFGYWSEQKTLIRLEESELYKRDKLGLKAMNENGQLVFLVSPGGHLELNEEWFVDNILQYLINTS